MPSRSTVRINVVIFTILGFVVALLIHFIVLSSPRYNWLGDQGTGSTGYVVPASEVVAASHLGSTPLSALI